MHERWGVPHMLGMTAAQEGGPVAVVIKAEAGEGRFIDLHQVCLRRRTSLLLHGRSFQEGSTELVQNRFCHVGEVRNPELIWPSRHELTIAEIRGPAVMACGRCRDPRAPTRKQG